MVSLMVKPTLIYLMLLLTTIQSSIAMGDVDQLQSSDSERNSIISTLNGFDDVESPENNIDPLEDEHDCSHCSLCHGHGCPVILAKSLNFLLKKTRAALPDYRKSTASKILSPLHRPPIS